MNNAKKIFLTGLLVTLLIPLYCQTILKKSIVVVVIDKTRKPISYSPVRIVSKSGLNILLETDSLGTLHFDLLCNDTYDISAIPNKFIGKKIIIESPCNFKKSKLKFVLKSSWVVDK